MNYLRILLAAAILLGILVFIADSRATPIDELDRFSVALDTRTNLNYAMTRVPSAVVVRVWCATDTDVQTVRTLAAEFPQIRLANVIALEGGCGK